MENQDTMKSKSQTPSEQKTGLNKTVVVLSLRRSGSSMLSGILHKLGVPMGIDEKELKHSSDRNKWGFWEDIELVRLSEKILQFTQNNPHMTFARIEMEFEDEIKEVLSKRNNRNIWGFKDVNQTQTHRLFKKHLNNPRYIVIFRNPLDVAVSMQSWRKEHQKVDVPIMKALPAVHNRYSTLLQLIQTIQEPMQFVSMERLKSNPEKIVPEIVNFLGIEPTEEQIKNAINHIRNA